MSHRHTDHIASHIASSIAQRDRVAPAVLQYPNICMHMHAGLGFVIRLMPQHAC